MVKKNYYRISLLGLENDVKNSGSHYFDKDWKNFFGSKVDKERIYKGEDNTIVFREKLTNAPKNANNVQVIKFDLNKGEAKKLYFGKDYKKAGEVLHNEIIK